MSYSPFYEELSLDQRVDAVLALAALPSGQRPRLLTIYTPLVDDAQHGYGVDSTEARAAISAVDLMIGRLTAGLKARGLDETSNIVIVADHGQMDVPAGHIVIVDNLIDLDRIDPVALGIGPTMAIWPKQGYVPPFVVDPRLLPSHVRVFARGALPERFHQNASSRQAPLTLVADPGYVLCIRADRRCNGFKGMHGYDNALPEMHALFVASGPAIARGTSLGTVENVGVYSLLAHLLGIRPALTDGTLRPFCAALRPRSASCAE